VIRVSVPVVLASASATRRELLGRLVGEFEVVPPAIDEGSFEACGPSELALKLAEAKAADVAARRPDALVIAADTLVVCEGKIIGKPCDAADAERILALLSRHPHTVLTAVAVATPEGRRRSFCAEARVTMKPLSRRQINALAAEGDVMDKAGAYSLTPDDPRLRGLEGSIATVMGLPLDELAALMAELYPQGKGDA
jgi:septum formation protein